MPSAPRLFSSTARVSSTPRRSASSWLTNTATTFLPLKVPGLASGALQVELKLVLAQAAARRVGRSEAARTVLVIGVSLAIPVLLSSSSSGSRVHQASFGGSEAAGR